MPKNVPASAVAMPWPTASPPWPSLYIITTMMPSTVPNKMSPSTSGDVNRSTILAFFSVFAENHCAKQNDRAKHKPLKRWQGWRALDLDIL